jgi:hypothetical protein
MRSVKKECPALEIIKYDHVKGFVLFIRKDE